MRGDSHTLSCHCTLKVSYALGTQEEDITPLKICSVKGSPLTNANLAKIL